MPISHPLQAIFVHIPKTAGTSVEAALGMHGARTDIGIRPYYQQAPDPEHLYGGNLQHMTAARLRVILRDDDLFARYFKFSIVRNPYERLVSTCAWSDQKWARGVALERDDFETQVRALHAAHAGARRATHPVTLPPHLALQSEYVLDEHDQPLVDFIGRYETLETDWQRIRGHLKVTVELPTRMRSHHRPYQDYYSEETRGMAAEVYARDLQTFGYAF